MIVEEEKKVEIVKEKKEFKVVEDEKTSQKNEKIDENKELSMEETKDIEKLKEKENINQDEKEQQQTEFKQIANHSETSSNHNILKIASIFIVVLLFMFLLILGGFALYNYQNRDVIVNGIYINNIDVSGLTKEEAKNKIDDFYKDITLNDITLVHNDYTAYIKTSEINLSVDTDSAINYAFNLGKTANIFSDNYLIFSAMLNGMNIMPTANFDEKALKEILSNLSTELPDAVVESGYYIEGKNLIITKGNKGCIIDVETSANEIRQKLSNLSYLNEIIELKTTEQSPKEIDLNKIYNEVHKEAKNASYKTDPYEVHPSENGMDFDVSLEEAKEILQTADKECTIPLKILYPEVTTNMIGQEAFPDLLASFSTKYAASNKNRTTNLKLAAGKIDGYVLLPEDTFSYNTVVGERTISAGYKEAAVYENGGVVQGLGGGICQISTTLCNAILFANLEIVELHNHQFVPSYVTAGRDATVVYGVKDFQFKNSRKHAIKITCSVQNGVASFQIWGVKEDTEYDVNVYANVTSRTSSYIKSATYRTLKLNGQTVKTEKIANFTYKVH